MAEEEREPGPRDWEPTDPDSKWWNPKPGDPYGPSDQEHPQPWERPPPVHRFPGGAVPPPPTGSPPPAPVRPSPPPKPPPENHPKTDSLLGVAVLALVAFLISCGLGVFVEDWRPGVSYAMIGAATLIGAVLVLAAAGSLRRALAISTRSRLARIGYDVVAVIVVFLIPGSVGAYFMSGQWLPAGYLVLVALVLALVGAIAASMVRDRVEKREQGAPTPRLVAQIVQGSVLFGLVVVCVGGVVTGAVFGFNRLVHDDLADRGTPVPVIALPELSPTWTPTDSTEADPVPQVRRDLEQRVLLVARVAHPVTSRCVRVDSGTADTEIQYACTVTYAGHDMVFTVIGNGQGDTGELDRYEARADRIVVTRKGLQAQIREAYPQVEELRCDEFPELALVSTAEPLPQHCYVKVGRPGRFMELTINPRDDGPPTYRDADA